MERGTCKRAAKICLLSGMYFALALLTISCVPESVVGKAPTDLETKAVLQAARDYLDAEVRRDYPTVYSCFAPSSDYVRNNSYEHYLAEASKAQESVIKYRIVAVTYIKNNEKHLISFTVEKIAQVEVDVTLMNTATQYKSEVNIGFIFLKEGGKWYKS
jgi:hypothetical protein